MGLPLPTARARARLAGAAPMITLALWLLALPLRIVFALGLRRAVIPPHSALELPLRTPTTGIAGCCARATSGHVAAPRSPCCLNST